MGIGALFGSLTLARLGDVGHKGRLMFLTAYLWAIFVAPVCSVQHSLVCAAV